MYPRLLEALGTTDEVADATAEASTLDVEVERITTAKALAAILAAITEAGTEYALDADWQGAAGTSTVRGIAVATPTTVSYAPADLLGAAAAADALATLLTDGRAAARRAPRQGADARAAARPPASPSRRSTSTPR